MARDKVLGTDWLMDTAPFPGLQSWDMAAWKWLLTKAVCCPVFVPVVKDGSGSVVRFDLVVFKRREDIPDALKNKQVLTRHENSINTARAVIKSLTENATHRWRVYADDGGIRTIGASGSLGLVLAYWAATKALANNQHPALKRLASDFMVTGVVNGRDGRIGPVEHLELKAGVLGGRQLVAPYANFPKALNTRCVNDVQDAQYLLAGGAGTTQRGRFPPCEVLLCMVGKRTEPNSLLARNLNPQRAIILLHSTEEEESRQPAENLRRELLETETLHLAGQDEAIGLREIDARRLEKAEMAIRDEIEKWVREEHVPEEKILIGIASGNKLMALAANNVVRGSGCQLIYREFYHDEYTLFGYDRENRTRPTWFIEEQIHEDNPS